MTTMITHRSIRNIRWGCSVGSEDELSVSDAETNPAPIWRESAPESDGILTWLKESQTSSRGTHSLKENFGITQGDCGRSSSAFIAKASQCGTIWKSYLVPNVCGMLNMIRSDLTKQPQCVHLAQWTRTVFRPQTSFPFLFQFSTMTKQKQVFGVFLLIYQK